MRRLILVGILTLGTIPAWAAHRITVSQLEQTLSASLDKHHSDTDIAHQLGNLELSERLTPRTLNRLIDSVGQQPQTTLALELMADQSALLDPPKNEVPATAPPDVAAQQHILSAARGYVVEILPRLPNFFATRSTIRFDDSAQVLHQGEWPVRNGFHPVGQSSRTVTVRDGREVADAPKEAAAKTPPEMGLYSFGEFGPILARTLTDLAKGKIQFSHWEESPLGIAAVYKYSVPRHESHYQVHFCCIVNQEFQGRPSYRSTRRSGDPNPVETTGLKAYDTTPAYHGTLAIDPVSGAIVRMTLDAELDPENPISRASTVVEYDRVVIGDHVFICPVRSLAISEQAGPPSPNGAPQPAPILSINESTFTQYHRLGSSSRVIADPVLQAAAKDANAPPQWVASTAPENTPVPDTQPPADAGATPAANTSAAAAQPPAPAQAPAPAAAPAEPVIPEMSMGEATGVPDAPANAPQPTDTGFSLKVTSRLVDVTVLAFDKKGHPVTDLKPEDFELYDDGKKQNIRYFSASSIAPPAQPAPGAPAPADQPATTFSNRAPDPLAAGPAQPQVPAGGTILLIDESHIAWNDLNYARGQMLQFLSKLPPGERVGLYSMTGLGFRVLVEITPDHAAIAARLKAFLPTAQSVSEAHEEERRNRQQFDTVHNAADLNSVNGNHNEAPDAEQPVDPELLTMGSNPARASMIILAQVARHLAAIPGHKSLVWVSSDNVLADWQDQSVGIDKSPNHNQTYAIRVQEAMNDAHTAVYPFDVSQLEAGGVGADMQHSSVELAEAAAENAATAASAGAAGGPGSVRGNRDTGSGRITAAMSQDAHPIQGMVREVAAGTGGRTIRRTGELALALDSIVADGRSIYQLSFTPSAPADDRYHPIAVKLNGRKGVTIRYRTGYLYAKEPTSLKDRFQQAVWQPIEATEIAVTAKLIPSGSGSSISINIAARDLAMEQRGGRWMDQVDIFLIQRDDAGIHAHVQGQSLGLRLKPATYQNVLTAGIPFERALTIPPNIGSLRVVVVDENSGRMGSVTIPISALRSAN